VAESLSDAQAPGAPIAKTTARAATRRDLDRTASIMGRRSRTYRAFGAGSEGLLPAQFEDPRTLLMLGREPFLVNIHGRTHAGLGRRRGARAARRNMTCWQSRPPAATCKR
jgi:hypothetical protein